MRRSYRVKKPKEAQEDFPPCDVKGCKKAGCCRAPKDRTLKEYYHFCPEHAAEYNKNWDYYKDMSADDIERTIREDTVWQRPTWAFGKKAKINDPLGILGEANGVGQAAPKMDKETEQAMHILGLTPPLTKDKIKRKYRELAKQYHPDKTGGNKEAEERFRRVVEAYNKLSEDHP
jgi:hypothetical protein